MDLLGRLRQALGDRYSVDREIGAGGMATVFLAEDMGMYRTAAPGIGLVLSGVTLLGVSLVLLLRGPFRMPLTERIFRLVWLGPIARAFIRFAARRARTATGRGPVTGPSASAVAATPAGQIRPAPIAVDRIAALEGRVSELERWRNTR